VTWGLRHAEYATVSEDVVASGPDRGSSVPPLRSNAARESYVQLTYDDGPDSAGNTRKVLDELKGAGARATFYLVGKRVAQGDNWRLVFDMAASGQWLGNHAFDWNDATDNHIFLNGTAEERASKIVLTEWAIRDALVRGRDEAKKAGSWDSIPEANRRYIEDVIARGTGRFRTPGFKSHAWTKDGAVTGSAIVSASRVLEAMGMRSLVTTDTGLFSYEGSDVDPRDWERGKTKEQITAAVASGTTSNDKSILLHSRLPATAAATPDILKGLQAKGYSFDPTPQGTVGQRRPKPGFAGLSTISDPPTHAQIAAARKFLADGYRRFGGYLAGSVAVGIFQLAQLAGPAEVMDFAAWIRATKVTTDQGEVPLANWMNANPDWSLFAAYFENFALNKPLPRVPGLTQ
jgi:peptidoglycan/xylan/chitin deacetylase (PgdA/CDA1 family)